MMTIVVDVHLLGVDFAVVISVGRDRHVDGFFGERHAQADGRIELNWAIHDLGGKVAADDKINAESAGGSAVFFGKALHDLVIFAVINDFLGIDGEFFAII